MSFSLRRFPTLLFVFFGLTISLFAQSTAQTGKLPRGAISGRVTIKDKGVAGVVVGMRKYTRSTPLNNDPFAKTTTDQEGNYRFNNLAAASYEVVPSAPGFVVGGSNARKAKNVIVNEDETVDGINFSLVRGGVITGRVTDADGRPAIQQGVQLYLIETGKATDPKAPKQPLSPASAGVTDDRGIYRIYGINPGQYKVASGKGDDAFAPPTPPGRFIFKQAFYPGTSEVEKATILDVTEGSETKDVDITLGRALQTFSVTGRVVDDKDTPVPNLRFGFQRRLGEQTEFVNSMAVSNSQGDFIVDGLIAGKYGIFMFPNQDQDVHVPNVNFDIVDQDVSGVIIKLSKGASLSGVVILESEDKTAFEKLSKLQLRAFVMNGNSFGGSATSTISPDGGFRLAGLSAGTVNLMLGTLTSPMPLPGFYVSRIERDGVTQPKGGVELRDGEQITNLRIVLAYGTATLRGQVKLENGSLPEGAQLFVRIAKPGETGSFLRSAQVDARGNFMMEGIAPGIYELTAQIWSPGSVPAKVAKREVSVQDGVTNEVVVTLDMSAPVPKP